MSTVSVPTWTRTSMPSSDVKTVVCLVGVTAVMVPDAGE